ncbi:hypothetical protein VIH_000768 [Vibrio cholerae CT 5369-93]|nr:hypothetical protein VIH_000768 [Vibrio cholerae CT 5369-93]
MDCPVESIVFDERHKVLSTPAYMLAEEYFPSRFRYRKIG